jgi:hypothetical protein
MTLIPILIKWPWYLAIISGDEWQLIISSKFSNGWEANSLSNYLVLIASRSVPWGYSCLFIVSSLLQKYVLINVNRILQASPLGYATSGFHLSTFSRHEALSAVSPLMTVGCEPFQTNLRESVNCTRWLMVSVESLNVILLPNVDGQSVCQ